MNILNKLNNYEFDYLFEKNLIDQLIVSGYAKLVNENNFEYKVCWEKENDKFFLEEFFNQMKIKGYDYDSTLNLWFKNSYKSRDVLKKSYNNLINNLGTSYFCIFDEKYKDIKSENIKINLNKYLISELETISRIKGISLSKTIEMFLLNELNLKNSLGRQKERLEIYLKERNEFDNQEIKFLLAKFESNKNIKENEIYSYLNSYYIKYFKSINLPEKDILTLKKIKNENPEIPNILKIYYNNFKKHNFKNMEELKEVAIKTLIQY